MFVCFRNLLDFSARIAGDATGHRLIAAIGGTDAAGLVALILRFGSKNRILYIFENFVPGICLVVMRVHINN